MAKYYFRHKALYNKPEKGHISEVGDVTVVTDIQESDGTTSTDVYVLDAGRHFVKLQPRSYPDYITMFLLLIGE